MSFGTTMGPASALPTLPGGAEHGSGTVPDSHRLRGSHGPVFDSPPECRPPARHSVDELDNPPISGSADHRRQHCPATQVSRPDFPPGTPAAGGSRLKPL